MSSRLAPSVQSSSAQRMVVALRSASVRIQMRTPVLRAYAERIRKLLRPEHAFSFVSSSQRSPTHRVGDERERRQCPAWLVQALPVHPVWQRSVRAAILHAETPSFFSGLRPPVKVRARRQKRSRATTKEERRTAVASSHEHFRPPGPPRHARGLGAHLLTIV